MQSTRSISQEQLSDRIRAILGARGLSDLHAGYVADGLVTASLRGVDTHGIALLPTYLRCLGSGRCRVAPDIRVTEHGAMAAVDANDALGIVGGRVATDIAIRLAREYAVGVAVVRNSSHFGIASIYTLEMARHGMVGLAMSNTDALVAPHGGRAPFFGTNPISFSAPAISETLCIDMAVSNSAYSSIRRDQIEGIPIASGLALDEDGVDIALSGRAPFALLPVGNHKGQCLAMMVEVMCCILGGAPFDHELSHLFDVDAVPMRFGHVFIAFSLENVDRDSARRRLQLLLDALVRQTPAGGQPVRFPGSAEQEIMRDRIASGIPISEDQWDFLQSATNEC